MGASRSRAATGRLPISCVGVTFFDLEEGIQFDAT